MASVDPTPTKHRAFLLAAMTLSAVIGCGGAPSKPPLMANYATEAMSAHQLRALDYEYASRFGQLVAACAEQIASDSKNEQVRDGAYRWRMWASPQARAAAFDQDPFAGLVELWVLAIQQREFFTDGAGRSSLGPANTCAAPTVRLLEAEAQSLASKVVAPARFDGLSNAVVEWAAEHPIEGQLEARPTARADIASLFSMESQGGFRAVGSMEETLRDMNDRITILTVQLPEEARWQAEFLVSSLFDDRFASHADSLSSTMEDLTSFLGDFERTLSLQTSTLLDGFQRERVAVFDAVEDERQMILGAIEEERVSVMSELDRQLAATTDELEATGKALIDHFFTRLIEVLVVVGIVVVLIVLLVVAVARRLERRAN